MNRKPKTDATTLLGRVTGGDRAALEEVCKRYGPRVYGIVRRRLGRRLRARVETADVAQDAMAEIVEHAGQRHFRSEGEFLSWVRSLIEHRIVAIARYWKASRRRRSREVRLATGDGQIDARGETPSEVLDRGERLERLCLAASQLAAEDREIIVSRLFLDLSWRDVASSLGTTEEAAQMRFVRARRRLARELSSSD